MKRKKAKWISPTRGKAIWPRDQVRQAKQMTYPLKIIWYTNLEADGMTPAQKIICSKNMFGDAILKPPVFDVTDLTEDIQGGLEERQHAKGGKNLQ